MNYLLLAGSNAVYVGNKPYQKKWQVESESLCILHLHPQLVDMKYKKKTC
jgi:hypothetical protein